MEWKRVLVSLRTINSPYVVYIVFIYDNIYWLRKKLVFQLTLRTLCITEKNEDVGFSIFSSPATLVQYRIGKRLIH